jgi:hypothetical protein
MCQDHRAVGLWPGFELPGWGLNEEEGEELGSGEFGDEFGEHKCKSPEVGMCLEEWEGQVLQPRKEKGSGESLQEGRGTLFWGLVQFLPLGQAGSTPHFGFSVSPCFLCAVGSRPG